MDFFDRYGFYCILCRVWWKGGELWDRVCKCIGRDYVKFGWDRGYYIVVRIEFE